MNELNKSNHQIDTIEVEKTTKRNDKPSTDDIDDDIEGDEDESETLKSESIIGVFLMNTRKKLLEYIQLKRVLYYFSLILKFIR